MNRSDCPMLPRKAACAFLRITGGCIRALRQPDKRYRGRNGHAGEQTERISVSLNQRDAAAVLIGRQEAPVPKRQNVARPRAENRRGRAPLQQTGWPDVKKRHLIRPAAGDGDRVSVRTKADGCGCIACGFARFGQIKALRDAAVLEDEQMALKLGRDIQDIFAREHVPRTFAGRAGDGGDLNPLVLLFLIMDDGVTAKVRGKERPVRKGKGLVHMRCYLPRVRPGTVSHDQLRKRKRKSFGQGKHGEAAAVVIGGDQVALGNTKMTRADPVRFLPCLFGHAP